MSTRFNWLSITALHRWGVKGSLSILDQGLYSGANFVLSILLARWLSVDHYGIFALMLALFQFALQIQNGVLLEPMSILGPARHQESINQYIANQIVLNFVVLVSICTFFSLGLLSLVEAGWGAESIRTQALFTLLFPILSLPWLVRRVFYIKNRPEISMFSSLLYSSVLLTGTLVLYTSNLLSIRTAVVVMGLAAFSTGLFVFPFRAMQHGIRQYNFKLFDLLKENWVYGKWAIATGLLVTIATQFQLFTAVGLLGTTAAGALRASQNLIQPMSISVTSIMSFALPSLSRDYGLNIMGGFEKKRKLITGLLLCMTLTYMLLMVLFRFEVMLFIYGQKYVDYSDLLLVWMFVPVIMALNSGIGTALRARQHPELLLLVSIVWAIFSLITSIIFTTKWGIWGATISTMLGYLIAYLATLIAYNRLEKN
ncbi:MAG TPA: lipopolysaccharide biosynthesis protein [Anaerolineales bacterium]|nr:lipopolysaccharide biosynthesis protein [Anaerolineales bacterium]